MATLYSKQTVATARVLHKSGMRTGLIAKELGCCSDTVRKWITGALRNGPGKRVVFTRAEVREIRFLRAVEGIAQRVLATRFGTTQTTIGRITRGEAYKDAGGYILAPKARDLSRKLSAMQVRKVRELRASGHSAVKLAKRFRVSKALIFGICGGYMRAGVSP